MTLPVLASLATGVSVALLMRVLLPPTSPLAGRVRPYAVAARTRLGGSADTPALGTAAGYPGVLGRLMGPPLMSILERVAAMTGSSGDQQLLVRLRQARLLVDVPEERRVTEYRTRQIGNAFAGTASAAVISLAVSLPAGLTALLTIGGTIAGASRWPSRVGRTIEGRRDRMRIELYSVNHLLAMHVRAGGGAVQAVQRIAERGRGEIVEELRDALAAHRGGLRPSQAFERIAASTPESSAARTYRLLASGSELGADLALALRALSDDIRDERREALRRQATRRRAAMLVPIIGLLAPTMLLFIAAPLPSLVFGAR